jgi:hypothetical protein
MNPKLHLATKKEKVVFFYGINIGRPTGVMVEGSR